MLFSQKVRDKIVETMQNLDGDLPEEQNHLKFGQNRRSQTQFILEG